MGGRLHRRRQAVVGEGLRRARDVDPDHHDQAGAGLRCALPLHLFAQLPGRRLPAGGGQKGRRGLPEL